MRARFHARISPPDAPLVLSLRGITRRFGSLVANDAIDLDLRRGEILALLGENGAGKTTLMSILFGHYVADEGEIRVADRQGALVRLTPGSPRAALDAGIGMVHQHFALAESLTVLENVVLGTRPLRALSLDLRGARRRLEELMRESGLRVDPDARVAELAVGEKQRVEILKVLYRGARILVLDEPTAVLTPQEAQDLFAVLRRLAAAGLAIVFISHKLAEVVALAGRVAVLRGGRKVADRSVDRDAAAAERASLAALMVGREIAPSLRGPRPGNAGMTLLVLDGVSVKGAQGRAGLRKTRLVLESGEILGIAGVSGNGQGELAGVIAGTVAPEAGTMRIGERPVRPAPRDAIAAGIARIPEDRHRDGSIGALSIAENLAIESLDEPSMQRLGFLRSAAMAERASAAIAAYDIRCPGPDAPIRLLSGGNMQKVILARGLERSPRVVLAHQPTRGLDVGASADVHRRLLAARERGAGIVLISEDLDELFALADRIAVIAGGELSEPLPTGELSRESIGLMMAGHAA